MRDANRIDQVLKEIGEEWKKIPDWRLGQLFVNLQSWTGHDMFYYEDDRLINALKQFISGTDDEVE